MKNKMRKLLGGFAAALIIIALVLSVFSCAKVPTEDGAVVDSLKTENNIPPENNTEKTGEKTDSSTENAKDLDTKEAEQNNEAQDPMAFTVNDKFSAYEVAVVLTDEETAKNKEYTIGNIKSIISKKNIDIIKFCKDVNLLNIRGIGGGPIIVYSDEFKNILYDYIDNGNKDLLLNYMNNNMKSFSGNKFSDIEGLIINDNGNIFQIKINDDISHDIGNFAAYERFILAFIKFWKKYDIPNFKNKSYTGIINKIFLDFIEFNDVKFEDFELVPPGNCYIGDLCYKLINDLTVETMCRINKLYKNIYRILFKSLKRYKKYNANFYYLTEDDIKYWNFIIDEITAYLK